MNKTVIKVENLSKKYILMHQNQENYIALRDVITERIKRVTRRIIKPFQSKPKLDIKEEFWALKNISFEIKQGEVIGIIGSNGAGKSTLLKILSRITEPTTGRVHIRGRVASLLEVGTGFHPELTGRENIFLNGSILGMSNIEIKKKFDKIVDFAEIEKFLDTPVKRYSSGMYVRLAFSVAAHLEPEILLVDEVLAVGDIAFQKKCLGKMEEVGETGRTIIYVSHNLQSIRTLCPKTIYMKAGRISYSGLTHLVVDQYENDNNPEKNSGVKRINVRDRKAIKGVSFFVKKIELQNIEGENTAQFKFKDNLIMNVVLSGEPKTSHYSFEFRIFGTVGAPKEIKSLLCVGASGPFQNLYFEKKIKKIKIEIGPLTLSNGEYSISTSIIAGNIREDIWEDCCSFQVTGCHPYVKNHEVTSAGCILHHSFSIL